MSVKSFGNPASSFRSRFGKTGNRASNPFVAPIPFAATGGDVSALAPGNGYKYHTFTNPGTFTVTSGTKNIEVLVVGGGGGAGGDVGGGGGAGGLAYNPSTPIVPGSYPVVIGGGGSPGPGTAPKNGGNGNPSTFNGITALGGGYGGGWQSNPGGAGGSGGGPTSDILGNSRPATQPTQPQPAGTLNYGNPSGGGGGNPGSANNYAGAAGGGGAGSAGTSGTPSSVGGGGNGLQYPQIGRAHV